MRVTIHIVSRREYWRYALGVREARRALGAAHVRGGASGRPRWSRPPVGCATRWRTGPRTVKELGSLGGGFVGNLGLWVDLVRVPPSGTWERRRADRLALAEDWVGPPRRDRGRGPRAPRARLPASVRPGAVARHRVVGRHHASRTRSAAATADAACATATRTAASSSTCRTRRCPIPTRRPRSGSCRTGTRTCWSMRGGPGCCPRRIDRGCSASRTRSRSGPISSTASWPARGR